jgi:rhamnogalacturonyl hydrolase YesR
MKYTAGKHKNKIMKYTKEQLDNLVELFDADGVWAQMQDEGLEEESTYIEQRYFNL